MDLDIGIKNSFEVVNAYPQMIDKWDFAVNEECFYYGEVSGAHQLPAAHVAAAMSISRREHGGSDHNQLRSSCISSGVG